MKAAMSNPDRHLTRQCMLAGRADIQRRGHGNCSNVTPSVCTLVLRHDQVRDRAPINMLLEWAQRRLGKRQFLSQQKKETKNNSKRLRIVMRQTWQTWPRCVSQVV